jgi:hypothetical protein
MIFKIKRFRSLFEELSLNYYWDYNVIVLFTANLPAGRQGHKDAHFDYAQ